ncbi:hypothetical protein ACFOY2_19410 [Nonomuraea purpurea]|uniref:Uncharacterized protein n=1 Tax=Nonomuraea purpurea TaxID=1849276 RepID=A0ABV8G8L5_9ACTN
MSYPRYVVGGGTAGGNPPGPPGSEAPGHPVRNGRLFPDAAEDPAEAVKVEEESVADQSAAEDNS